MSTVQEVEAAIRSLSPEERQQLVESLSEWMPELDGDAQWERIIRDPRPRPALSALGDQIEAECLKNPEAFPEVTEADFERNA